MIDDKSFPIWQITLWFKKCQISWFNSVIRAQMTALCHAHTAQLALIIQPQKDKMKLDSIIQQEIDWQAPAYHLQEYKAWNTNDL